MTRLKFGIAAVVLLAVAVVSAVYPLSMLPDEMSGVCMKVGLLFGALWLAHPQFVELSRRTPRWLLSATVVILVVAVVAGIAHAWLILGLAAPALIGLWFFATKFGLAKRPAAAEGASPPEVLPGSPSAPPKPKRRPRRRSNQ